MIPFLFICKFRYKKAAPELIPGLFSIINGCLSSKFGSQFFFESSGKSAHNICYLSVSKCLFGIFQNKAYSIGFLSFFDIITLINVKEGNVLHILLFSLQGYSFDLGIFDMLIQQ